MSHHPLDEPDDKPAANETDETNPRFDRIRSQLYATRSRQFGLAGLLAVMAIAAMVLAFMRQSGRGMAGAIIPLTILFGFALSVTGLVMLCESGLLAYKEKKRLAGTFFRFGLVLLVGGLPGSILLSILFAYLVSL